MAKTLDRIVVIDLEATCWTGDPPDGQVSEVIEIGVCPVEVGTGDVGTAESLLVAPQRSTVSPFCTALTTLTAEQVAEGMPFAEACGRLRREYRTRDRLWASWGITTVGRSNGSAEKRASGTRSGRVTST